MVCACGPGSHQAGLKGEFDNFNRRGAEAAEAAEEMIVAET